MRLIPTLCLLLTLSPPAFAQDQPIRETITDQLAAFDAGDTPRAFSYASPTIRSLFGTPENFARMVRQGYPMVWQHGDVKMLDLRSVAGNLWQRVMITDAAGRSHLLDYKMIETPEGWQIDAVQLLPEAGTGA